MENWTRDGDGDRKLDEIIAELTRERMGHGLNTKGWKEYLEGEALKFLSITYGVNQQRAEAMVTRAAAGGETMLAEMVAWMRLLQRQGRDTLVAERLVGDTQ